MCMYFEAGGTFQMTWAVIALFGGISPSTASALAGTLRSDVPTQRAAPPVGWIYYCFTWPVKSPRWPIVGRIVLHNCFDIRGGTTFFQSKALPYLFLWVRPPSLAETPTTERST